MIKLLLTSLFILFISAVVILYLIAVFSGVYMLFVGAQEGSLLLVAIGVILVTICITMPLCYS